MFLPKSCLKSNFRGTTIKTSPNKIYKKVVYDGSSNIFLGHDLNKKNSEILTYILKNMYYKIYLKIVISLLSKNVYKILLDPFLCNLWDQNLLISYLSIITLSTVYVYVQNLQRQKVVKNNFR